MATGKLTQTTAQIQEILNNASNTATTSKQGLMSSNDKSKLDGIETGAQVNANGYTEVIVGDTVIDATTDSDTLQFTGSNVTLTGDTTNKEVTIGITKANVTSALGYTPATSTHTHTSLGAVEFTGDITADKDIQINDSTLETLWNSVFG